MNFVNSQTVFRFTSRKCLYLNLNLFYKRVNVTVAENAGRLPLLPNHWKISFYKGTKVTRVDHIDDNFVGFINEPFSRILDTENEYHDNDCVGTCFYKKYRQDLKLLNNLFA